MNYGGVKSPTTTGQCFEGHLMGLVSIIHIYMKCLAAAAAVCAVILTLKGNSTDFTH